MQILETISQTRAFIAELKKQGKTIAFVPTMGNLHAGHLDLVARAQQLADVVGVSIFVNPLQFGPQEDFDCYPRTFAADCEKLKNNKVDFVFAPSVAEMYGSLPSPQPSPMGTQEGAVSPTLVTVPSLNNIWCGAFRPGHFDGVATVVLKLFNIVTPDVACFGEKDFQQLMVIKKLVNDLLLPIEIVGVATKREEDGLAMSSRNQYLSREERQTAALIYQTLQTTAESIKTGATDFRDLEKEAMCLLQAAGFKVDYFAICHRENLTPAESANNLVILVAAYLGKTRLIDNILLA